MASSNYDLVGMRQREFPWEARGDAVHFDHAAVGPYPQRTRDALSAYEVRRAEPHRLRGEDFFPVLDSTRAAAARLIRASQEEIALTTNTSWGVNLAAFALPLKSGDTVLGSEGEFPANVYPWITAAKARGFTYELLPMVSNGPDEESILSRIESDPRVKCVALSWVSFWSGARVDIERIGKACRDNGVFFAVDSIQGLGPLELDLSRVQVDVLSCGGQKWLCSPWGSGFVYVRRELIGKLEPPAAGWLSQASSGDFERFLQYDTEWHHDARRFEVGTIPFQDMLGMSASLSLFEELGSAAIERHVQGLASRIIDWAASTDDVELATPVAAARRAGIVAFKTPDVVGDSRKLFDARVTHSVREGFIRLSPHFHNTSDEVDAVLEALGR